VASERRPVVFVAVAAAHVLLLYGLAASRKPLLAPASDEPAVVSLWLPPAASTSGLHEEAADAAAARSRPARVRSESRNPRVAHSSQPQPGVSESGAPTASPEPGESTSGAQASSGPIDWYGEVASSASTALGDAEKKGRQAAVFAPPPPPPFLARPPPGGYRFGWSAVATQRFRIVNGVPILRITEHCSVVFFITLPVGTCTIGKIQARGDLFQHMHDPPPQGQADLP